MLKSDSTRLDDVILHHCQDILDANQEVKGHITVSEKQRDTIFLYLMDFKKSYDKPGQHIKKQSHHFADKGLYSQRYGFSGNQVRM